MLTLKHLKIKKATLALVLLFSSSFSVFSQKYNVLNYTTKDGLPSQIINDLFQDNEGYFWIATQSGISRFNGNDFSDFAPVKALEGIDAVSVVQDSKGRIILGTNTSGIFIYDYKKTIHFDENSGLKSNVIRKIFIDHDDVVWVLTSAGVYQLINDRPVLFKDSKQLFDKGVLSMTQNKKGDFYFGTQGNHLVKYDTQKKFTYFNEANGITDNYIFSISTIGDSVLLGTTSKGVLVGYKGQFRPLAVPGISQEWISAIIPKSKGFYIISSSGAVDYKLNGTYSMITEENGLTTNDLFNGFFDREGNLWLSSSNGISCIRKQQIISLDSDSGLSNEKISCLAKLSNGLVAAGTYGMGINLIDASGKVVKHIISPELENSKVTCIYEIPDRNEIWVGGEQTNYGIIILDTKNGYKVKNTIKHFNNIYLQTITKIEQDASKRIWVGTFNAGLFCITGSKIERFGSQNGLPSNEIYTFCLDHNSNPWVSIYQKGLYKKAGATFQKVYDEKWMNDKYILSLQKGSNQSILVGTKAAGLVIVKDKTFKTISTSNGLLSNAIQSIELVGDQIWLGTNRGLNLLVPQNGSYKIITFDQRSGLKNTEIQQNAIASTNGFVWVGSSTGISRVLTDQGGGSDVLPFIRIQGVKLFFNDIDWKEKNGVEVDKQGIPTKLDLGYKENHLTFSFSAMTNSSVFYTYIMENQDEEWTPLTDKRDVTYSNLNPGEYIFKIKSVDNYGNESAILSIPVIVNSPWWQTWWFRITALLLGAIALIAYLRYREKSYKDRQQVLESTVQERTSELYQKNKEILDSITYAKRIQTAMLPSHELLEAEFKRIFVVYRPKDIVAGDFYWFDKVDGKVLIAVADCTGHGVPGAMVSVVCNNALNRATREFGITQPASLLNKTRELILAELSKSNEDVNDGMDISLATIDSENGKIEWAGANNPLWILSKEKGGFVEIKGDKQPVGRHINNLAFTNHEIVVKKGDILYFFTDGLADQFGGEKGKKLKSMGLKELLLECANYTMEDQKVELESKFDQWKGEYEQIDDVCLIGIKI
ncbi:MAG: two-component regulator propeller domain-containing protein [Bacteroidota bacterium]